MSSRSRNVAAAAFGLVVLSTLAYSSTQQQQQQCPVPQAPNMLLHGSYARDNDVEGMFAALRTGLDIETPPDPIAYVTSALQNISTPRIVIAGAPASGKGTQCEMLVKTFGFVHISTGDLFRKEVNDGSDLGKQVHEYMSAGNLVPDDLVIGMVKKRLKADDIQQRGWLLDGFPRTVPQLKMMQDEGIQPNGVVVLDVPDSVVIERIEGRRVDPTTGDTYHLKYRPPPNDIIPRLVQRSDDTRPKIEERLRHFHAHHDPLLQAYTCPVHSIAAGALPPEEIFSKILRLLQSARWATLATSLSQQALHKQALQDAN